MAYIRSTVVKSERRKERRLTTSQIPQNYQTLKLLINRNKKIASQLIDISQNGCSFLVRLPPGAMLPHRRVILHGFDIAMPLVGRVTYIRDDGIEIHVGVEFEHTYGYSVFKETLLEMHRRIRRVALHQC